MLDQYRIGVCSREFRLEEDAAFIGRFAVISVDDGDTVTHLMIGRTNARLLAAQILAAVGAPSFTTSHSLQAAHGWRSRLQKSTEAR